MEKIVGGLAALIVAVGLAMGFGLLSSGALAGSGAIGAAVAAEIPAPIGPTAARAPVSTRPETVVFAGGCFWGVQGVFQHVKGVESAVSGYIGGDGNTASYALVSGGQTGHAEAVQITYDPSQVSYGELMRVFFSVVHDPTQLNRQGPDRGTQYRSAVFTTTAAQRDATDAYLAQLAAAGAFPAPIVTQVESAMPFYAAEDYHQDYLTLHPQEPYIRFHDAPKLAALEANYPSLYRATPVLVQPR